jgi:serine protease Do
MAGIQPGSLILSVNKTPVNSVKDFKEAITASLDTNKVLLLVRENEYARWVALRLE